MWGKKKQGSSLSISYNIVFETSVYVCGIFFCAFIGFEDASDAAGGGNVLA